MKNVRSIVVHSPSGDHKMRATPLRIVSAIGLVVLSAAGATIVADLLVRPENLYAASTVLLILLYAALAGRVSYRWFDSLVLLVPIYGVVWAARIMWRVAFLPLRDWPPRRDEIARCMPVETSGQHKRSVYILHRVS